MVGSNRAQRRAAMSQARKNKDPTWMELPIDSALHDEFPALRNVIRVWRNDFWIVQLYGFDCALGRMRHLAIRSVAEAGTGSGQEPRWSELQRIKTELLGDCEAVQVYPRAGDVMDQADMYHLFVLPEGWPLPFGLHRESGFVRE